MVPYIRGGRYCENCADENNSPHPSAPDKPPFETIVGLMSAPIDKVMDMFAKFPSEEEKQKAKS